MSLPRLPRPRLAPAALACSSKPGSATREPVRAPSPAPLPASLTTCNVFGELKDGLRCQPYDTKAKAFSPSGDGSREDALARRVFLFERWLDLYVAPEKQVVVRNMTEAMAPTDPESRFGDEQYLGFWDDHGDSAGFGEPGQIAALYLQAGVVNFDPDDPDLTKLDELWGYYLPQYNKLSAPNYPTECPATLTFDASDADSIDVSARGFEGKALLFFLRLDESSDHKDSMDFAYITGVRAGDAVMLQAYALGAYHLTGDTEFLRWRDQALIGKSHADQVGRTIGAFKLPKPCRVYYRNANVYTAHFMRTLLDGDPASRAFAQDLWKRKFAGKEERGLRDALFAVTYSAAMGAPQPELADGPQELLSFGGPVDHLDSPRRNYAVDLSQATPAGVSFAPDTAANQALCATPVTVLGLTIPTPAPDPNVLYCATPSPVMQRPPDNWVWERGTRSRWPICRATPGTSSIRGSIYRSPIGWRVTSDTCPIRISCSRGGRGRRNCRLGCTRGCGRGRSAKANSTGRKGGWEVRLQVASATHTPRLFLFESRWRVNRWGHWRDRGRVDPFVLLLLERERMANKGPILALCPPIAPLRAFARDARRRRSPTAAECHRSENDHCLGRMPRKGSGSRGQ